MNDLIDRVADGHAVAVIIIAILVALLVLAILVEE